MVLNSILLKYDQLDGKIFQEIDCFNELEAHFKSQESILTSLEIAQSIALGFSENYSGIYEPWDTYFGPMYIADGVESPSKEYINKDILEHWKIILDLVNHPILKARYSGLIWDFTKQITKNSAEYGFVEIYIKSLIESSLLEYSENEFTIFRKLERAIKLSLSLNNSTLYKESKNALLVLESKVIQYENAGLWGYAYDILIRDKNNYGVTKYEEQNIITNLETILNFFIKKGENNIFDPFGAEPAALRLITYYNKKKNHEKVISILRNLKFLYLGLMEHQDTKQFIAVWLEKLILIYHNYKGIEDLKSDINELLEKLELVYRKNITQFSKFEILFNFDPIELQQMESFVDLITNGSANDVLLNLSYHFVPDEKISKEELFNLSKQNHIRFLIGTTIKDHKGRTIAKVGSYKTDPEGNYIRHLTEKLKLNSVLLRKVIERIKSDGIGLTDVKNYLKGSNLIDEDKWLLIDEALSAYFNSNHIVFAHLIIPQIEDIFRNIIIAAGGTTLIPKDGGYFEVISLDAALNNSFILNLFGANFVKYFKIVFTDKIGWNLRNRIAHGLISPKGFNQMTSDYLFHSFLCFGLIRIQK